MPDAPLPPARAIADALQPVLRNRRPRLSAEPSQRAGVLLLLYDRNGRPHVVLTKRTDHLLHHRGQICLPGGRWEEHDLGLRETALRETEEELGVPRAGVRVVGQLDDTPTMVSGYVISPFVGVLEAALTPVPNAYEIARVLEVPLDDLLAADALLAPDPAPMALRYPLQGEDVWGATARILRGFARLLRCALSAPRTP
jgi:8-oxo-dGTP pyrophosphatase MutT (NUDIX family)